MTFDVVIIGAGPGGFDTAIYAKKQGLNVLLIEKASLGGTCLNWGCIPTKAIYQNAKTLKTIQNSHTFGIDVTDFSINLDTIKERKEQIVSDQIKNIQTTLQKLDINYIEGTAQIKDSHHVHVNNTVYETKYIIIATGSTVSKITFEGDHLDIVKTSKELLDLDTIPTHLTVIGGGVIGIEMAAIFHGLGSEVDVIEYMPSILPSLDSDISRRAKSLLKRSGIKFHTKATFDKVTQEDSHFLAHYTEKNKTKSLITDTILVATGRAPNFGNLRLEEVGINHSKAGIIVNAFKQTNIANIYAIGDVNGENMLAHKATYDGYQAINHILNKTSDIRFDLVPGVVFSFPEIASVGVKEDDLEKGTYEVHKALFKANAKAQCLGETEGYAKLIIDHDRYVIGTHIIGPHASDLIHECTALMNQKITIDAYANIIHAHPTISEVLADSVKELV
ncbi:MAG: dihydrolipoyl dehydrogenase [Candidatus Izemoplasma sp.]|nr:dihydrolipoyl dehydrogenase [Candidatus Izemoplasma sp.]